MNALILLIIENTRKISRFAVNSYTRIVYFTFWYVFLLPFLPNLHSLCTEVSNVSLTISFTVNNFATTIWRFTIIDLDV